MSLRHKLLIIFIVIWVALIGLTYIGSQYVISSGHVQLEKEYAKRNVNRVAGVIKAKLDYIERHNKDIAQMPRAVHFLNKDTQGKLKEHYQKNNLIDTELGLYTLWSPQGELRNGYYYDFSSRHFLPIPSDLKKLFKNPNLLKHAEAGFKGLIEFNNSYWLVSILPVYHEKILKGYTVVGMHLSEQRLMALGDSTKLNFQIIQYKRAVDLNYLSEHIAAMQKSQEPYIELSSNQLAYGYMILPDLFSNPAIILKVSVARDIVSQGQNTVLMMFAFLCIIATLVTISMWFMLNELVFKRIQLLSKQIVAYDVNEDLGYRIQHTHHDELSAIATSVNKMLDVIETSHGNLEERVKERTDELLKANKHLKDEIQQRAQVESQLRYKEAELQHMAHHDALTGLPNRVYFNTQLANQLERAEQDKRQVAVMFLDVDRFKYINDSLGHDFGDVILQHVARRIQRVLREEDTVARLGGDEFVLFASNITAVFEVEEIAKRILDAFNESITLDGRELHVSLSVGVSLFPKDGKTIGELESCADIAMYRAKALGGNQFHYYTSALDSEMQQKLDLEVNLRKAISDESLLLFYQPILDVHSKKIASVEALCRWQHPDIGMISPNEFIPVAEETGLIYPIGEWVLREACSRQVAWLKQGYEPIIMSINISVVQFRDNDFAGKLKDIIEQSGIDPAYLELEFKESVFAGNRDVAFDKLCQIKSLGVRISLDDFGTGYSSLNFLKDIPIDTIKIDQSFVSDIESDEKDKAITDTVLSLGHNLGISVLGEGIETISQLEYLLSKGCDLMQGYLFSHAVNESALMKHLHRAEEMNTMRPSSLWPRLNSEKVVTLPSARLDKGNGTIGPVAE